MLFRSFFFPDTTFLPLCLFIILTVLLASELSYWRASSTADSSDDTKTQTTTPQKMETITFCGKSRLLESLGAKTTLFTPKDTPSYTLKFRINEDFSVLYGTNRRFVVNVTQIPPQKCVHIDTGGQFLVGEGFIPVC